MNSAIAVETTENRKTGPVSVTMASQASCPKTCSFLKSGCYAETGPLGYNTAKLNRTRAKDPVIIAKMEAAAIGKLSGTKPLRLHVVGDCSTTAAVKIVSSAVENYGRPVWGYTHAWRTVARKAWSKVSMLASCETASDVKRALGKGYATALVVSEFVSDRAYQIEGLKVIPCPQQTGKSENCTTCRLCWDDGRLREIGATIAFAAHGCGAKRVREQLVQIRGTL